MGSSEQLPNAAELLTQGEENLLRLNYEQALSLFLQAIEIEPADPRGYIGAADAYFGLGQVDQAASILRQGLAAIPGNSEIQSIIDLMQMAASMSEIPNGPETPDNGTGDHDPDLQLWDNLSVDQRGVLERLEAAVESLDHISTYSIVTSEDFLGLFAQLGIDQAVNDSSRVEYITYGNAQWSLQFMHSAWGDSYSWQRATEDMLITSSIWLWGDVPGELIISYMNVTDGVANGDYTTICYMPDEQLLFHYLGSAENGLIHGAVTVSVTWHTGELEEFNYQFDHGVVTNHLLDERGQGYVLGSGGTRWSINTDHVYIAGSAH